VDPAAARQLAALSASDQDLAKTLAEAPTVLAIVGSDSATGMLLRAPPFVVSDVKPGSEQVAPGVPQYAGVLTSLDQLDRAAIGHGLISIEPSGGPVRRIPLAANVGGTLVPALAIEMLRVAQGASALRLLTSGSSVVGIQVGDLSTQTEEDGAARVYFSQSEG